MGWEGYRKTFLRSDMSWKVNCKEEPASCMALGKAGDTDVGEEIYLLLGQSEEWCDWTSKGDLSVLDTPIDAGMEEYPVRVHECVPEKLQVSEVIIRSFSVEGHLWRFVAADWWDLMNEFKYCCHARNILWGARMKTETSYVAADIEELVRFLELGGINEGLWETILEYTLGRWRKIVYWWKGCRIEGMTGFQDYSRFLDCWMGKTGRKVGVRRPRVSFEENKFKSQWDIQMAEVRGCRDVRGRPGNTTLWGDTDGVQRSMVLWNSLGENGKKEETQRLSTETMPTLGYWADD